MKGRRKRRLRQLDLGNTRSDAANARALPEGGAGFVRRRARVRLSSFPVATSKAAMTTGDRGFRRGERIYFFCPFHHERTPSCVWYPKGSTGKAREWTFGSKDELSHLAFELMLGSLHAEGRARDHWGEIAMRVARVACTRYWYERCPNRPTAVAHFHCYGCGAEGGEGKLVRGLLSPVERLFPPQEQRPRRDYEDDGGDIPF